MRNDGRTLNELCEHRQGVTQHLDVPEAATRVATVRRGREKLRFLNPVPLQEIHERWIANFKKSRLKAHRNDDWRKPMARSTFVCVTYINHTGEAVVSADRRRGIHEAVLVRHALRKLVDGGIHVEARVR